MEKVLTQQPEETHRQNVTWLKENNLDITFTYEQQKKKRHTRQITICIISQNKEEIARGIAIQNPSDTNNRVVGRTLSFLNATAQLEEDLRKAIRAHSPIKMRQH